MIDRSGHKRAAIAMILPFALVFVVFTLIPILSSVVLSFTYFNMLNTPRFVGLENYIRMFAIDNVFPIAVRNTLIFAVLTGPVGFLMSFLFAWLINELPRSIRPVLTLAFYAPTLAGNLYFIWLFIFSGDSYGLVNSFLLRAGILSEPVRWLTDTRYSLGIVVLVMLWLSMGAGFLSLIAGLQNIDRSVYEAGTMDGIRNRWQELWYITLPQMVSQMLFAAVMSIAASFAVGYQSMALTGFPSTDYSTHTIVLHIYDMGSIRYEMGYASAIAVFLFAAMAVTWKIIQRSLRRLRRD
jgi:multiple sugar transport system permease protein